MTLVAIVLGPLVWNTARIVFSPAVSSLPNDPMAVLCGRDSQKFVFMEEKLAHLKHRIGCSTLTFHGMPLEKAIDTIASRGFRAIDIAIVPCHCCHIDPARWTDGDSARLLENLQARGMRVSSLNVFTLRLPSRREDEPLEFIAKALRIAASLGAYTISVPPGPPSETAHWLTSAKLMAKRFQALAEIADGVGVRLSVEAPHANTLAEDYAQTARLFELIADPRVGCTFDTSHAQRDGRCSITDGIYRVGAEIVHVHLRDALGKDVLVTPGKGACDYYPFFAALSDLGYKGDFNLELEYGHASEEFVGRELEFAQSYLHLLLSGSRLPSDFARWKSKPRQMAAMLARTIRDPKEFVVNRPSLKSALKPFAQAIRRILPKPTTRYEVRWRKRWGIRGLNRIEHAPRPAQASAAPGQPLVRVGILGCGGVGDNMHAPGFARLPGVEVVGVCDTQADLADETARRIGCRAFYNLADLVRDARPTLVANCTKEWVHYSTSMYLLENGIDVFCEKIMAEEVAKGEQMVRFAAEKGRILGVNFNWRFLPGILKIRSIEQSGVLGELCALRFLCHSWVWHHVLDLAEHLGGGVVSVSALLRREPAEQDHGPWRRVADDMLYLPGSYAMALLETKRGPAVSITSSGLWNPEGCLFSLDAVFRRGTVSLSGIRMGDAVGVLSSDRDHLDLSAGMVPRDGSSKFCITFQRSIEAFAEAYLKKLPVPSTGADALRIMRLERAVTQSAAFGQRIRLSD